jgi:guanine deaminase
MASDKKKLTIPQLFYMATLGGAHVCNLEHQVGSFEEGKAFDALVVNVRNDATYLGSSSTSATNFGLWGVDDDEVVGLEHRRCKNDDAVASQHSEDKHTEELEAMLERFLFCGDDRNIRRVYVQGKWVGGAEPRGKH